MLNGKITIIIPVYNTAAYLDACVQSVVGQTYKNIEILLVNDGSTDDSADVCAAWQQKDTRVTAITQQNGGLAAARNTGLRHATGEWVLFLDSDDMYADAGVLQKLFSCAQNSESDVLCFNYARVNDADGTVGKPILPLLKTADIDEMLRQNIYQSSACIKLLRKSLLDENGIFFERGTLCEDIEFSLRVLLAAECITYMPQVAYLYRVRGGSISQTVSQRHVADQLRIMRQCGSLCHGQHNAQARERGLCYTAYQYCTLLINLHLGKATTAQKKEAFALKDFLQYDKNRFVHLIHCVQRVLGVRFTAWLLSVYFRYLYANK